MKEIEYPEGLFVLLVVIIFIVIIIIISYSCNKENFGSDLGSSINNLVNAEIVGAESTLESYTEQEDDVGNNYGPIEGRTENDYQFADFPNKTIDNED